MINSLLNLMVNSINAGFSVSDTSDVRARWENKCSGKICSLSPNGDYQISDIVPDKYMHFIIMDNHNAFFRISLKTDDNTEEVQNKINKTIKYCKDVLKSINSENLSTFCDSLSNLNVRNLLLNLLPIKKDIYIYFDLYQPFIHTEKMVDISKKYLNQISDNGTNIGVDAFGRHGVLVENWVKISETFVASRLYARNKDIPGLKRAGKNGTDLFPMTRESLNEISNFYNIFFKEENAYKDNIPSQGVSGHYIVYNKKNKNQCCIISTINANPYYELSLGKEGYAAASACILQLLQNQTSTPMEVSGKLLIIEWGNKGRDAGCIRLDKTISSKHANQSAINWHRDIGVNPKSIWTIANKINSGLTVLSFFELINTKWIITKRNNKICVTSSSGNNDRIHLKECYDLYLGDNKIVSKMISNFIASKAPISMIRESTIPVKIVDSNFYLLYYVRNLLLARAGINMSDHPCFVLGRLFEVANWMQCVSYEMRSMKPPTRLLGANIIEKAYKTPSSGYASLCQRIQPILGQCQKIENKLKIEANAAANDPIELDKIQKDLNKIQKPLRTWRKTVNSIDPKNIPLYSSNIDKICLQSGYCHFGTKTSNDASGEMIEKTTDPLANQ